MINLKKYTYQEIINLIEEEKIKKKIINKGKNKYKIDFFGEGIENLMFDFDNLTNTIEVLGDYQYKILNKYRLHIPINIYCNLREIITHYEKIPTLNQDYPYKQYHNLTQKKFPYFDLVFYTTLHKKTADFIPSENYLFLETREFLNNFLENPKENFSIHPKQEIKKLLLK